jgi:membrane protease YdiL (CAAX protease family)
VDPLLPEMISYSSTTAPEALDGSWETKGRSPNSAAIVGMLGIGALYFNIQSVLVFLAIILAQTISKPVQISGTVLDRFSELIQIYANPIRIVLVVSEFGFMLAPALWAVKHWHSSRVRNYIRLKKSSLSWVALTVVSTAFLIPASNLIAGVLIRQLHIPHQLQNMNAGIFTSSSAYEFLWLTFVVCITPAFCEEIFFRGFIQRTFERTIGGKSVLLTGLFFGLFHFQPLGLITLATLGILFGYFFYRTRSLLPSMAAHFTNNMIAILSAYQFKNFPPSLILIINQNPLWFALGTLPIGIGFLLLFYRVTRRNFEMDPA